MNKNKVDTIYKQYGTPFGTDCVLLRKVLGEPPSTVNDLTGASRGAVLSYEGGPTDHYAIATLVESDVHDVTDNITREYLTMLYAYVHTWLHNSGVSGPIVNYSENTGSMCILVEICLVEVTDEAVI